MANQPLLTMLTSAMTVHGLPVTGHLQGTALHANCAQLSRPVIPSCTTATLSRSLPILLSAQHRHQRPCAYQSLPKLSLACGTWGVLIRSLATSPRMSLGSTLALPCARANACSSALTTAQETVLPKCIMTLLAGECLELSILPGLLYTTADQHMPHPLHDGWLLCAWQTDGLLLASGCVLLHDMPEMEPKIAGQTVNSSVQHRFYVMGFKGCEGCEFIVHEHVKSLKPAATSAAKSLDVTSR